MPILKARILSSTSTLRRVCLKYQELVTWNAISVKKLPILDIRRRGQKLKPYSLANLQAEIFTTLIQCCRNLKLPVCLTTRSKSLNATCLCFAVNSLPASCVYRSDYGQNMYKKQLYNIQSRIIRLLEILFDSHNYTNRHKNLAFTSNNLDMSVCLNCFMY